MRQPNPPTSDDESANGDNLRPLGRRSGAKAARKQEAAPSAFGSRLRAYREERGLTLTELSEETGHSKGYLSSLENNHEERRPSAEVLYTLAKALGVTMSDLMGKRLLPAARPEVPPSLDEFARRHDINEADVYMLASIQFRGEQPRSVERWQYIYNSIRTSKLMDDD